MGGTSRSGGRTGDGDGDDDGGSGGSVGGIDMYDGLDFASLRFQLL